MSEFRTERDSMGELQVPSEALWGAQTQRAVNNFPISGRPMPAPFIRALGLIKRACAEANRDLDLLDAELASAIIAAAGRVADNEFDAHFPVDVYQTGSGTSSNMNANEVIATLARQAGAEQVHPNDHVNMSQSSNDVIPTAIQVSGCLGVAEQLLPSIKHFRQVLDQRAEELAGVAKTGRTHLMDAMPVTLGQELATWSQQMASAEQRLGDALSRMRRLPQGGTAVGTGINAHPEFGGRVAAHLASATGFEFESADNKFEGIATQDAAVELSGQLKTLAVSLMKIANDLRWMNSGPLAGLGEIELEALQPGSSIMPGKVNPVIPEAVCMVAARVMGNDSTITVAGQAGNFQLNVMLPLVGATLLESIGILGNAIRLLADRGVATFKVREDTLNQALARNPILVTALNRVIGYEKGAALAKQAYKEGRSILDVAEEMTDLSRAELETLLDPLKLTDGGL
ncbi:class II fumarate hydratase [Wenzhouxiangella marina]|uniref:Fumarate hydratase class II n=1 Tax=Wenzhouxiangella marina TaxID=1579979 RepID=A0A0K0XVU3_9GAMM|nr:class II fumarate hydratase [Wenzhouxiangella marina]AKS41803.1 Fumarate hydratase class II [Wenzhouxiangella marina]MBB6086435.1 fumarate hydratase class II [Wenzhouxiangella marina]